ncbi:IclR family transcriptional regulator [Kyrpidia spormannii]|uniref:IclR family transcriptional regulator n=2 Tax=Kyrpidia spormannii TaxID=2055160 RepID=A0ACA8ZDV4_9BACL|nr:IclR family transcriptional regulator [Kyrpidia spormannii]CAB3392928.1 IclR family transcriptional regulator [Kyrpidia spormannii]CAB3393844.1 IclR family transcriptional regulator [Kyrpidia spormannii]
MDEKYIIPSVDQAAKILQLLSRVQHRHKTFGEICDTLGIPKTTCLRLLRTLSMHGLVWYDQKRHTYSLGPALVVLGARAEEALDYLQLARDTVSRIAEETGLTTVAAQRLRRNRLTYVAKADSHGEVHVTVSLGQQFPIDRGSFGKCFCAYMDDNDLKDVAAARYSPEFLDELADIRRKGFAVSREEQVKGINGVAAPVFDSSGQVLLAVACLGIAQELTTERMTDCAHVLVEHTQRLTREIGGSAPEMEPGTAGS